MPESPLGPTYLRAPNLHLTLDGPLQLGHIIANPYRPTKPIYTLNPLPATIKVPDLEHTINRTDKYSINGKFWANLFQGYNVNVGAESSGGTEAHYTMESLETEYFKRDPTDKEAAELAKKEDISEVLNRLPSRPVYMITGLKVAKNLKFSSGKTSEQAANAGGSGQVTDQVAVGGELGGSRESEISDSFRLERDVILAYQLHIIAKEGWFRQKTTANIYEPKGGFQNRGEAKEEVEEEPVETRAAVVSDLLESADMYEVDTEEPAEAEIGDKRFVVISFNES